MTTTLTPQDSALIGKYAPGGIVLVLCDATDGAFTVYLPDAQSDQRTIFVLKKTDSSANAVTIETRNSQEIDGASNVSISSQYDTLAVMSDRTNFSKLWSI